MVRCSHSSSVALLEHLSYMCCPQEDFKEQKNPLKFIISDQVGTRSQVDLIDIRSFEVKGMKWILRYIDCLSGFSQVRCIPNKSSAVVGDAIIQILSASVRLLILQSDNGPEFSGK